MHQQVLIDKKGRDRPYFAAMRYEHLAALLIASALIGGSCKKDETVEAPVVTIIAPQNGFSLSVPDTLVVSADVSGRAGVDLVTVVLSNEDGVPVTEPASIVPSSDPARIEVRMPVLSEHIIGGSYTLTVKAFSGENSSKDYRHLNITGTPQRLRSIMVLSQPDAGTVLLHRIDSVGGVSVLNTFISDLGGAAVNAYNQTLCMMGPMNGPLTALAPDGIHVKWQKANQSNSGIPWFTSIDALGDQRIYAGTSDGALRGYNSATGVTEFVAFLATGFRAQRAALVGDRVAVAERNQATAQYKLRLCQSSSGAMLDEQFLDKEVVAIFSRDAGHALLFGNRNDQGVVEDRDLGGGGGWEPHDWTAAIGAVTEAGNGTYLVALENGDLERFTYASANSTTILSGEPIRSISFDPVGGLAYAGRGSNVIAVDPQSGAVAGEWAIGAEVKYVLVLLNK